MPFSSRILTRSPTWNAQSMCPFSLPVSRSTSFQVMLHESDARLISGIRSSHSRPSGRRRGRACVIGVVAMAAAVGRRSIRCIGSHVGRRRGMSFIPQIGQVPGASLITSGCIGHVQVSAAGSGSP